MSKVPTKATTTKATTPKAAQGKVSEQAGTRPAFTISEAEVATGASRSTLRRRLAEGAFPNAYTTGKTKQWRIPVEDLLGAGLKVNAPSPGEQQALPVQRQDDALAQRVVDLERALAVEQARRAAAEQLAEERAERVEDLRGALRLLEVGPLGVAQQQAERQTEQAVTPAPRRGWFSRRT